MGLVNSQSDSSGPDVGLEPRPGVLAGGYLWRLEGGAALAGAAPVTAIKLAQLLQGTHQQPWTTTSNNYTSGNTLFVNPFS